MSNSDQELWELLDEVERAWIWDNTDEWRPRRCEAEGINVIPELVKRTMGYNGNRKAMLIRAGHPAFRARLSQLRRYVKERENE